MTRRILIVDDQPDMRKLTRLALEMAGLDGLELHEASDGETGLVAARTLRPALVLLDVVMPGALDGLEVCARIRRDADLAGTRVLLMTARGQAVDLQAGREAGADAMLVKPVRPSELVARVRELLGRAGG
ncbi:MAG: hypothetical protein RL456_544 [Pseudomonadota bacterium]|jgi:DNA-binding response OmpR family regulator